MYYYLFILAVGAARLVELAVAQPNATWSFARGGREFGRDHYPAMVSMHALLLVSCVVEVWVLGRGFIGWLGWPMLAVVALSTVTPYGGLGANRAGPRRLAIAARPSCVGYSRSMMVALAMPPPSHIVCNA